MSIYTAQLMHQLESTSAEYSESSNNDDKTSERQLGKLLKGMGENVKSNPHLDLLNELEKRSISTSDTSKPGSNLSFG